MQASGERKIYIVGTFGQEYANWCEGQLVDDMEDASIVLFTGGEDVTPELYGKKKHYTTGNSRMRDAEELMEFKAAQEMGKPMLGICRGSQFLCAMAGGILVQNQTHPSHHDITTNDGRVVRVTSSHHQRQYIQGLEPDKVELIAWAEHLSPYAYGESDNDKLDEEKEVEIAFYPEIKALAIQSHPEWAYPCRDESQEKYIAYCRELLNKYLG
jgi:phosphoribosylformylglycinamidine (FGAM) synthase-like amidotransferase family enzyme